VDQKQKSILEPFRNELANYGPDYKPTRGMLDLYSYVDTEPTEPFGLSGPDGEKTKIAETQKTFLRQLAAGDRKSAILTALQSEQNNIGIPSTYFYDLLERDSLLREAKSNDEVDTAMGKPVTDLQVPNYGKSESKGQMFVKAENALPAGRVIEIERNRKERGY